MKGYENSCHNKYLNLFNQDSPLSMDHIGVHHTINSKELGYFGSWVFTDKYLGETVIT